MIIHNVFDLHYQQFLIQIEGTQKEADKFLALLTKSFRTGKDGKSKLMFLIIRKGVDDNGTSNRQTD